MECKQSIGNIMALIQGFAHTNVVGATPDELVQALQNQLNIDDYNVSNVLLIAVLDKAQAVVDGALTPQQMLNFFVNVAASLGGICSADMQTELADEISETARLLSHISIH